MEGKSSSLTHVKRPLIFALNGSKVELHSLDPSLTLLSYIRSNTQFTGTKLSCGEGGCGACVVLVSKYNVRSKQVEEYTVCSCLTLLCSIHGCSITTTEGLGSTHHGFHAVHRRLAGFHGSQCGFCSPGMCISIYSSLRKGRRTQHKNCPPKDEGLLYTLPQLSSLQAQQAIAGNLCRCTGYRPILDACKSFTSEVDLEDLGINAFWSHPKQATSQLLPAYSPSLDPAFPEFLIDELETRLKGTRQLVFDEEDCFWATPSNLEAAFELLEMQHDKRSVKLVVGNTSAGLYKDARPQVLIDISHIPELLILRDLDGSLEVGAAVTIQKLIDTLDDKLTATISNGLTHEGSVFSSISRHLKLVANPAVRNSASVGGNLIMAQQFSFESDLATIFLGAGVSVLIITKGRKKIKLTMEEFLQKDCLEPGTLLQSIIIPLWPDLHRKLNSDIRNEKIGFHTDGYIDSGTFCIFKTYRASPRRLGNAVAYVNTAFFSRLHFNEDKQYIIKSIRLAFGAFGQKHAIRAKEVENFLVGKVIDPKNLLYAVDMLKTKCVIPSIGTTKAAYRSSVATGFLFKFFSSFLQQKPAKVIERNLPVGISNSFNHIKECTDFTSISGNQKVEVYEKYCPVGRPIQKIGAESQAAGEAVFVDDVPCPKNCLFAAFVCSQKASAKIDKINAELALSSPGVVAFISASDIPLGGKNLALQWITGSESLFASDVVEFIGHPLGVVVADTPEHARYAAMKVDVIYSTEIAPILSVEEAVEKNSCFSAPPELLHQNIGDVCKGFSEGEHRINCAEVRTGSQYFFYMENQTALAIPDEGDCLVVYSSCQGTELLQSCIATCLGVPLNNIRIITRRVGGGFGGKALRSVTVAAACAVATHKLRHPVRMYLDRRTDMVMMGGRHPTKSTYSAAFTSTGKITALQVSILIDAGWSPDFSPFLPMKIMSGLKKYNWGALDVEFKVCKTNLNSKTAMRAPGNVQGSFIADTVIEHVAATLGLDVHTVIEINMHSYESAAKYYRGSDVGGPEGYTLPSIWNVLRQSFEKKEKAVKEFNQSNMWFKRGLAATLCVYHVLQHYMPARVSIFKDGSIAIEVGGVELGQGLWTKVKQTAIFGLSRLCHAEKLIDLVNVRVVQADSISLPNGGLTIDSTTSEGSCEAVRQACEILVDRLFPIKMKLEEEHPGGADWMAVIKAANFSEVDLSAQTLWSPKKTSSSYLNYGAAASEVQIDILTGEARILQTDILYDCGKSLNPAIDVGQIEGAFVQGIGFFMTEEHVVDQNGRVVSDGTWSYKPPTIDNIPQKFNVEILNGPVHHNRILSSKACGEPPLLLAGSVHSAIRRAIEAAQQDACSFGTGDKQDKERFFRLDTPLTCDKIKENCDLSIVEQYLRYLIEHGEKAVQAIM